ncbi:MAG: M1 family metallopeptidase [Saprospiraceae bacterium]|nr:M1 family metallopeptidase [Saprospiraceae bacterium]NNL93299.1 M1 family metallopeptidase [Saprospiraceae bacterium]
MKFIFTSIFFILFLTTNLDGQRWQQRAEYDMEIDFDVNTNQFEGKQKIKYFNNSPDTLYNVFYHLYFNAFQPGSMMDVRSRTIPDPDRRVADRILNLQPDEIGYHKINSLKQDGENTKFEVVGTILEVKLHKPILPGKTTKLEMTFESQVPLQVRRSGRDNREGIRLSMSQWYPKLSEYDYQGWHANPYIGREFHGVWGDFNVKIKIDRTYTVAASGKVKNPSKMGHGYSDKDTKKKKFLGKKKLTWEFLAEDVHDFVWAADPDYTHAIKTTDQGTELHYFYQENERTKENWEQLHRAMNAAEKFMNSKYGVYPYPVYSFIQGGDGGMEYPMATLITGERSYPSLVGVSIHEWMHSWYQMVLGTNESLYAWMDEGFTSYASAEVMNHLRELGILPGDAVENPHANTLSGFARFSQSGLEEPLSTHADHFQTNQAYGVAAYTKGSVFLKQLSYIIGEDAFQKGMLRYFDEWKFRHPNPNDFIRVMEKTSGLELDWYREYWVNTTHQIDYAVESVNEGEGGKSQIVLKKLGYMPMPVDLVVELNDGREFYYTIPLRIMRGEKSDKSFVSKTLKDWPWTNSTYIIEDLHDATDIKMIKIDPQLRTADIDSKNNVWPRPE